jgi:hypothetical protein
MTHNCLCILGGGCPFSLPHMTVLISQTLATLHIPHRIFYSFRLGCLALSGLGCFDAAVTTVVPGWLDRS